MGAGKTFENVINNVEVSLGITRLLVAPFGVLWEPTQGRIDLDAVPAGFEDLGAVVQDSPTLNVTREKFQLALGIPAVLQKEFVIGLEGTFEISLHTNSWRKAQFAFGNVSPISSTTQLATISSITNQNVISFANTVDVTSLTLGRQFVIAPTASEFDKADAVETRVASITADGLTFFLRPTPLATIAVNNVVGIYDFVQQFIGTACIREHTLLGVSDFTDSSQVIHHFFKATPGDEFTEEIRPSENERFPLSFNAFGISRNDIPGLVSSQLVIARRVYYPGNSPDQCA